MATRTKRTLTKNYGSFHLEGLMKKSAESRVVLNKAAEVSAAKTKSVLEAEAKTKLDMLEYKLCRRKCVCTTDECKWLHYSICEEVTCAALLPPMASCRSDICKRARLQEKKRKVEEKQNLDAANKISFAACRKAHAAHGTRTITCPCNLAAMEDIEVEPVTKCKWEGWSICSNPPCDVLVPPMGLCKKRACAAYRKSQPAIPKRKQARKTTAKKRPLAQSSAHQFSDSSEDEDTDAEVTPRKRIPRKSSARLVPVKPAVLDSGTSSSEDVPGPEIDFDKEDDPAPDPVPAIPLQRDKTVTLPDVYEVEKILEGPREDGKYFVKWVGYSMNECTWEPETNLNLACFDEYFATTSEKSGDDQPIYKTLPAKTKEPVPVKKINTPPAETSPLAAQEPEKASPQKEAPDATPRASPARRSRLVPVVATRTTFESRRTGMRQRKGRADTAGPLKTK
jgi:hypothetical protein